MRFHVQNLDERTLDAAESRHATQVLRLKEGALITAFNGRGKEAKVRITSATKERVEFEVLSQQQNPAPACNLHLGQALPKGKAMDWILQKVTELGVQSISPIQSDRSVVSIDEDKSEHKLERWTQTVTEACKQCGQNWMPQVHAPSSLQGFLDSLAPGGLRLIGSLQPEARPLPKVLREAWQQGPVANITYLVGPEGDFTPAEMGKARAAGFLPVSLGPNILRTETATLYLTSALLYEVQNQAAR